MNPEWTIADCLAHAQNELGEACAAFLNQPSQKTEAEVNAKRHAVKQLTKTIERKETT